jgi:O-antigen biosynthesis protein WbqV
MGEPVRILDLAREYISLQGGDPDAPDAIRITELRPGERLHEALTSLGEQLLPTTCEYIDKVKPDGNGDIWPELIRQIEQLRIRVEAEDEREVCRILREVTKGELASTGSLELRRELPATH